MRDCAALRAKRTSGSTRTLTASPTQVKVWIGHSSALRFFVFVCVFGGVLSGSEGNSQDLTSTRIYLRVSRLSERKGFV